MRFPRWCRHEPDNSRHIERVEKIEQTAQRQLIRSYKIAVESSKATDILQDTARRNHFGESLETSYARRNRKQS